MCLAILGKKKRKSCRINLEKINFCFRLLLLHPYFTSPYIREQLSQGARLFTIPETSGVGVIIQNKLCFTH